MSTFIHQADELIHLAAELEAVVEKRALARSEMEERELRKRLFAVLNQLAILCNDDQDVDSLFFTLERMQGKEEQEVESARTTIVSACARFLEAGLYQTRTMLNAMSNLSEQRGEGLWHKCRRAEERLSPCTTLALSLLFRFAVADHSSIDSLFSEMVACADLTRRLSYTESAGFVSFKTALMTRLAPERKAGLSPLECMGIQLLLLEGSFSKVTDGSLEIRTRLIRKLLHDSPASQRRRAFQCLFENSEYVKVTLQLIGGRERYIDLLEYATELDVFNQCNLPLLSHHEQGAQSSAINAITSILSTLSSQEKGMLGLQFPHVRKLVRTRLTPTSGDFEKGKQRVLRLVSLLNEALAREPVNTVVVERLCVLIGALIQESEGVLEFVQSQMSKSRLPNCEPFVEFLMAICVTRMREIPRDAMDGFTWDDSLEEWMAKNESIRTGMQKALLPDLLAAVVRVPAWRFIDHAVNDEGVSSKIRVLVAITAAVPTTTATGNEERARLEFWYRSVSLLCEWASREPKLVLSQVHISSHTGEPGPIAFRRKILAVVCRFMSSSTIGIRLPSSSLAANHPFNLLLRSLENNFCGCELEVMIARTSKLPLLLGEWIELGGNERVLAMKMALTMLRQFKSRQILSELVGAWQQSVVRALKHSPEQQEMLVGFVLYATTFSSFPTLSCYVDWNFLKDDDPKVQDMEDDEDDEEVSVLERILQAVRARASRPALDSDELELLRQIILVFKEANITGKESFWVELTFFLCFTPEGLDLIFRFPDAFAHWPADPTSSLARQDAKFIAKAAKNIQDHLVRWIVQQDQTTPPSLLELTPSERLKATSLFIRYVTPKDDELFHELLSHNTLGSLLVSDEASCDLLDRALLLAAKTIVEETTHGNENFNMLLGAIRLWSPLRFLWLDEYLLDAVLEVAQYLGDLPDHTTTIENLGLLAAVNLWFSPSLPGRRYHYPLSVEHSMRVDTPLVDQNFSFPQKFEDDLPLVTAGGPLSTKYSEWTLRDLVLDLQRTRVPRGDTKTLLPLWALLLRLDNSVLGQLRTLCTGELGMSANELCSKVLEFWNKNQFSRSAKVGDVEVRWSTHLRSLELATTIYGYRRPPWVSRLKLRDLPASLESERVMTTAYNRLMFSGDAKGDLELRKRRRRVALTLGYDLNEGVVHMYSLLAILSVNQAPRLRRGGRLLPSELIQMLAAFFRSPTVVVDANDSDEEDEDYFWADDDEEEDE